MFFGWEFSAFLCAWLMQYCARTIIIRNSKCAKWLITGGSAVRTRTNNHDERTLYRKTERAKGLYTERLNERSGGRPTYRLLRHSTSNPQGSTLGILLGLQFNDSDAYVWSYTCADGTAGSFGMRVLMNRLTSRCVEVNFVLSTSGLLTFIYSSIYI
jgi:hypothetical protein